MKNKGIQIVSAFTIVLAITLLAHTQALAQDGPVARITFPTRGQALSGNITIQGTATSPSFARYTVSYALEPDLAAWTDINGAAQPQANGMLAVWNTRPVADGTYALRLQVVNSDGSTSEAIVRELTLANGQATGATGAEAGVVLTDTSGTSLTSTTGTTNTTSIAGIDTTGLSTLNLSDIPRSFIKGAQYALYAFAALGAYLLLKKIIALWIKRASHKPVDYGR